MKKLLPLLLLIVASCKQAPKTSAEATATTVQIDTLQGQSLLGNPLISAQLQPKDSAKVAKYLTALNEYTQNSDQDENIIWYGRRTAYLGDYQKAIS
ncbi:MAG: hypothetical protein KJN65_08395, partial [Croceitalea sp.]|nr:hypothetical protein [Croceitalea sp.]